MATLTAFRRFSDAGHSLLAVDPGVVGIGLARRDSRYVLTVNLADGSAAGRVPRDVDGVRVVTEVVEAVPPL